MSRILTTPCALVSAALACQAPDQEGRKIQTALDGISPLVNEAIAATRQHCERIAREGQWWHNEENDDFRVCTLGDCIGGIMGEYCSCEFPKSPALEDSAVCRYKRDFTPDGTAEFTLSSNAYDVSRPLPKRSTSSMAVSEQSGVSNLLLDIETSKKSCTINVQFPGTRGFRRYSTSDPAVVIACQAIEGRIVSTLNQLRTFGRIHRKPR